MENDLTNPPVTIEDYKEELRLKELHIIIWKQNYTDALIRAKEAEAVIARLRPDTGDILSDKERYYIVLSTLSAISNGGFIPKGTDKSDAELVRAAMNMAGEGLVLAGEAGRSPYTKSLSKLALEIKNEKSARI